MLRPTRSTINATPSLHTAAYEGDAETIRAQLAPLTQDKKKTLLESRDANGATALFIAGQCGFLPIMQFLVAQGADLYTIDKDGNTLFHGAIQYERLDIINYLLTFSAREETFSLHVAAYEGDLAAICWQLAPYIEYENAQVQLEKTQRRLAAINEALDLFSNIAQTSNNERSDEHIGILVEEKNLLLEKEKLKKEMIAFLEKTFSKDKKASFLELRDANEATALFIACLHGSLSVVRFLVEQRADLRTIDKYGNSLFHAAAKNNHLEIINYLLTLDIELDSLTNKASISEIGSPTYVTPIEIALENNRFDIASALFQELSIPFGDKWHQAFMISRYADYWKSDKPDCLKKYLEKEYPDERELQSKILEAMRISVSQDVFKGEVRVKNKMYLSDCQITDNSLEENWKAYEDEGFLTKLVTLDLSRNQLTKKSVSYICALLESNTDLKVLDLSGNPGFGSGGWWYYSGVQYLAESLALNNHLEELYLANTGMNNQDIQVLVHSLKANTTLRLLEISGNPDLTSDIAIKLEELAACRHSASLEIRMENNPNLADIKDRYNRLGVVKTRQNLFPQLRNLIEYKGKKIFSDSWATSNDISAILNYCLGNSAFVINPDAGSINTPLDTDQEIAEIAAADYVKHIKGYYDKEGELHLNGVLGQTSALNKPIIIPLNTMAVKPKDALDTSAIGGQHWVMCVILPKHYQPLYGQPLNNDNEIYFLIDSLGRRRLPNSLRNIWFGKEGHDKHNVPSLFPQARRMSSPRIIIQQEGGSDCGWWAVYNALMVVWTGSHDFMKQFKVPSRNAGAALRYLFSPAVGFAKDHNNLQIASILSQEIDDLNNTIEQAIHNLNKEVIQQQGEAELQKILLSMVENIRLWHSYTKTQLERAKSLDEKVLAALDKVSDLYQILPDMQNNAIVDNANANNALQSIKICLQALRDKLQNIYNKQYWDITSEEEHEKIVTTLVKDELYKNFQFFKTASRNFATGIYERKDLTPGESIFKAAKEVFRVGAPLISGATEGLKQLGGLAGIAFGAEVWTGADVFKGAQEIITASVQVSHAVSDALKDLPEKLNGTYSFIQGKVNDFLGTTEINKRIKAIANNFSGTEGQSKSERLAEEFVHFYREQILLLTKHDAKVFANLLGMQIRQFLMECDTKDHTPQDMISWLTQVSFYRDKNLKLCNTNSLVRASSLVQCAGLRCLDANGAIIKFDLLIQIDKKKGAKYAKWNKTDGATYGYRVADQDAIDALQGAIDTYKGKDIPSEEVEFKEFNISRGTLIELTGVALPLRIIPSPFQTVRERLKVQQDKISALETVVKNDKETISRQVDRIEALERRVTEAEGVIRSDNIMFNEFINANNLLRNDNIALQQRLARLELRVGIAPVPGIEQQEVQEGAVEPLQGIEQQPAEDPLQDNAEERNVVILPVAPVIAAEDPPAIAITEEQQRQEEQAAPVADIPLQAENRHTLFATDQVPRDGSEQRNSPRRR